MFAWVDDCDECPAMKTLAILALLLLNVTALADPNEDELAFFKVAGGGKAYGLDEQATSFKVPALPATIADQLQHIHGWNDKAEFFGFALDLNHDGKTEYVLETPWGGSGGRYYLVFAQVNGNWAKICGFQGWFHFLPKEKGWPTFVVVGRGGGGNWDKETIEFEKGKYKTVRIEHYERGKVTIEVRPTRKELWDY